ncbi:MAG TPA: hypothetical protein VGQ83_37110 [Polyangia bacterium]|jgi:hypothetical protein
MAVDEREVIAVPSAGAVGQTATVALAALHRALLIAAVATLAILPTRLAWLTEPYGVSVDESTYMAMGEVVARGGVPYVDALDRKPPGLFWLFAAVGRVMGPWNIHGVHLFAFGMTALLALGAALVARRLGGARLGVAAGLLYAVFSGCFSREIASANAEYPMLILTVLAAGCLLWSRPGERVARSAAWALAGAAAAAVGTLFKQYGALIYAPMYLAWAASMWRADPAGRRSRRAAAAAAASLAGLALVYVPVGLWFWRVHAADALWRWAVLDGFGYMGAGWRDRALFADGAYTMLGLAAAWAPLWLGLATPTPLRRTGAFRIMLWGGAGALATAFLSGRYFSHYFVPAAWFAALLGAAGLRAQWRASRRRRALLVVLTAWSVVFFTTLNAGRDAFYDGWKFNRARQAQLAAAGQWIRAQVPPGETIAVWGAASQLYVLAQRGSGTRHIITDLVSGRQPGFDSGVSRPVPGALETFLGDLARNRPAAFVDTAPAGLNDYGHFPLGRFPRLAAYVQERYAKRATVGGLDIWLRRPEASRRRASTLPEGSAARITRRRGDTEERGLSWGKLIPHAGAVRPRSQQTPTQ